MRLVFALLALVLSAGSALTADSASVAILGFSIDGRRFAFEEYGRSDGSGHPYSSIYLVDTEKNEWAAPPVHVRLASETATIGAARRQATARARTLLASITEPGETLASQSIAQVTDEPNRLRFRFGTHVPNGEQPSSLLLEELKIAEGDYEPIMGFRLTLYDREEPQVIHEDRTLPARRNTARGYRLGEVVAYRSPRGGTASGVDALVVLVMVLKQGFEGSDVRYMAVTAPLPGR
jgi:predicted secreted protein